MYAACGPSNVVERDSKSRLLELEVAYVPSTLLFTANAYDCCVACFKTPNCYGANYGEGFGQQSCELEVGSTCPANQAGVGGLYSYQRAGNIPVSSMDNACIPSFYAQMANQGFICRLSSAMDLVGGTLTPKRSSDTQGGSISHEFSLL